MKDLHRYFQPIVQNPRCTERYMEVLPSVELRPYIRCFWGSKGAYIDNKTESFSSKVIPDGCMDIIFDINYSRNIVNVIFCGINNKPFLVSEICSGDIISTFAIRFNFWAVRMFSNESMRDSLNIFIRAEEYFKDLEKEIKNEIVYKRGIFERTAIAENYLKRKLYLGKEPQVDFLNAVNVMNKSMGTMDIGNVARYNTIGVRKLERIFKDNVGMSPKGMSGIIRFQNSWQRIYNDKKLNVLDVTYDLGYNSQSHFIRDFKKYFDDTPKKAWNEKQNVAFLKYRNSQE